MKTWALILATVERQGRGALVTVAATRGSAPREAGARMVVTPAGYHGTIGGGTLEWKAIAQAQAMLPAGEAQRLTTHALGPELGQCCGGSVDLATEIFTTRSLDVLNSLAAQEAACGSAVTRSVAGRAMVETFAVRPRRVYVFGAGHVGRALVLALAPLPFDVQWIDPRPEAFPGAVPPNVTCRMAADPVAELGSAPEGSLVYIMSHSHALDFEITDAALRHPAIAHTGLIGSATKRARFERRLRDARVAEHRIAGLICPIGVSGIASKLPAAIAAATVAQILVLDGALALAAATDRSHDLQANAGAVT